MLAENHPKVHLECWIDDDHPDAFADELKASIATLASARAWTVEPPALSIEQPEDESDPVFVGAVMLLYSAFPSWDEQLPNEVDELQLAEVEAFMECMRLFSRACSLEVDVGFNGEEIGTITFGLLDRNIGEGLLREWGRELARRKAKADQ